MYSEHQEGGGQCTATRHGGLHICSDHQHGYHWVCSISRHLVRLNRVYGHWLLQCMLKGDTNYGRYVHAPRPDPMSGLINDIFILHMMVQDQMERRSISRGKCIAPISTHVAMFAQCSIKSIVTVEMLKLNPFSLPPRCYSILIHLVPVDSAPHHRYTVCTWLCFF